LYTFLETSNTKGFIVLKDGKIVLEKYFGTFTKDSTWYWASSSKALTALLVGIAQEEGFLKVSDSTSKYLGTGWTSCTPEQEGKITIWNQLTMTNGLDDVAPEDNHCTIDTCLLYKAPAGTRWAYHNAPYTLLENVVSEATGRSYNAFTRSRVGSKIGLNGIWYPSGFNNIFVSNVREYARFGLLAANNFIWQTDTILKDSAYKKQMVSTSQELNKSYGYLWWLNGKSSYMIPGGSQFVIPGMLAPDAPADMFAGIGKNGQIVSISKSEGIVLVRMGNTPGTTVDVPTQYTNDLWREFQKVNCATGLKEVGMATLNASVYPNPASTKAIITLQSGKIPESIDVYDTYGRLLLHETNTNQVHIHELENGLYTVVITHQRATQSLKLVKQ
jgi:CubicO group peptidase (beta-lactamase class C family)